MFSFPIQHLLSLNLKHWVRFGENEVIKIQRNIEEVVGFINNNLNGYRLRRCDRILKPCGSFYHMSKITAPDEFDFLIVSPEDNTGVYRNVPFSASKEVAVDIQRELAHNLVSQKVYSGLESDIDWPMDLVEREIVMNKKKGFIEYMSLYYL